jgi:hypothetical protein
MNRISIRLALSILFNVAFAVALIGLGGCSREETPKAEAVKKPFSSRFADSGDASAEKSRQKEGPKRK